PKRARCELREEDDPTPQPVEDGRCDDGAPCPPPLSDGGEDSTPGRRPDEATDKEDENEEDGGRNACGNPQGTAAGKALGEGARNVVFQLHGQPLEAVDQERAENGPSVVAGSTHDDQHPNGERHGRSE